MPGVRVAAFCDANPETLHSVADRDSIPGRYLDFDEMIETDLDAVIVATPMHLHVEPSVAALARGKHVMSEVTAAVSAEANATGDLYRVTGGLEPANRLRFRRDIVDYVRLVLNDEWPATQHARATRAEPPSQTFASVSASDAPEESAASVKRATRRSSRAAAPAPRDAASAPPAASPRRITRSDATRRRLRQPSRGACA